MKGIRNPLPASRAQLQRIEMSVPMTFDGEWAISIRVATISITAIIFIEVTFVCVPSWPGWPSYLCPPGFCVSRQSTSFSYRARYIRWASTTSFRIFFNGISTGPAFQAAARAFMVRSATKSSSPSLKEFEPDRPGYIWSR